MKKYFSTFRKSAGFTLIELLVVIGILGILAAALVATIDPFEQLKKADDAKIKNIVVEFQTANVRYFTTHGAFPWADADSTNTDCTDLTTGGTVALAAAPLDTLIDCLGTTGETYTLIGEGELKSGFTINTTDLSKVFVNWDPTNASQMIVCFAPTSKSQKSAKDTIWANDGVTDQSAPGSDPLCPDANAADGDCYWCTQ